MSAPEQPSARAAAEQLLLACQERLLVRIRWMMGESPRRIAESRDFLGDVQARILAEVATLRWRDADHFLALATRIARNLIVDQVRRPRVRRFESFTQGFTFQEADDATSPFDAAAEDEELNRLFTALEDLDPDHQRVIELRSFEGLSFREVGASMDRSEAAAQMLHARAVLRLGRALGASGGGPA